MYCFFAFHAHPGWRSALSRELSAKAFFAEVFREAFAEGMKAWSLIASKAVWMRKLGIEPAGRRMHRRAQQAHVSLTCRAARRQRVWIQRRRGRNAGRRL